MVNGGGRTFIEVGPGKVLSGLIQRISNDVKAVNVQEVIAEHLPHGSAGARGAAPAQRPISTRRRRRKP
jgi:malonyl CoA-acyl carrier protein transacylase